MKDHQLREISQGTVYGTLGDNQEKGQRMKTVLKVKQDQRKSATINTVVTRKVQIIAV